MGKSTTGSLKNDLKIYYNQWRVKRKRLKPSMCLNNFTTKLCLIKCLIFL